MRAFFFFKQKTAYEMVSDWSSDVCSSDLGGSGGPQWLSDHPNPGNRYDYINKEAESLRVENPIRDTRGFTQVRSHLSQLRSEERRVGKECRTRVSPGHRKKNTTRR